MQFPAPDERPTPYRSFFPEALDERLSRVEAVAQRAGGARVRVVCAYSVKTNPRREVLAAARDRGWWAETISRDEVAWARRNGFSSERTVYNGPVPFAAAERAAFVFADSVEALERTCALRVAAVAGVRLRPAPLASRFGIDVAADERAAEALRAARVPAVAVSFHARREDFHGAGWRDVAADVLDRAVRLERRSGVPVVAFDAGGGWTPEEFDREAAGDVAWLVREVELRLPHARSVLIEPGQAVATPVEALVARVLEVRAHGVRREAILDAGYPEWPQMHAYRHRLFVARAGGWEPLGAGGDRIGGRTCLEYDRIDGVALPATLASGDRLLIADTGSYDRSMAFAFAQGEPAPAAFLAPPVRAESA